MAILSFKKQFAEKILDGSKRQTIRAFRKYPIKKGDPLHLYTGLRTRYSRKLITVECKEVWLIHILFNTGVVVTGPWERKTILSTPTQLNKFARADGFSDFEEMKAFWIKNHGVKKGKRKMIIRRFEGILIKW